MNIHKSIESLIGNTPILELRNYISERKISATVAAKLEYLNPTGSVKDRAALGMILDAEARGLLKPGSVIIEPTSGNTGIGLAAIGAARGYRVVLTMPDTMSAERRTLLSAYGAELVLTPGSEGMDGAIRRAHELSEEIPESFIPNQFENPSNPAIHEETTAREIWEDTDGRVDAVVCGVGSGGTVSGIGRALKKLNPNIRIIAVEPDASPVLSGGAPGAHKLQGIGAGFVPKALDTGAYDEVITVSADDAYACARDICRTDGIFCGITSGAAIFAAESFARRPENAGKLIVAIAPDSGSRYLSTPGLFME
ncbi:MAG: cysteine synthase A [Oscillospiraceae bacterium]|nr:cysteine synthase A [Oscillospiraceae bacterium]